MEGRKGKHKKGDNFDHQDSTKSSPDGVSECATWNALGEGTGHRGITPRDEHVPQPTTLPDA